MKTAFSAALLLAPRAASACAICFGGLDTKAGLARGLGWAVAVLLTVTLSLVGAIGWALWSVERGRRERDA